MKSFKKKTLALVLASVVSIVGSFASENYKNSIMAMDFMVAKNGTGALFMILHTKTNYTGNVTPVKKDANTYVLMLPEVSSEMVVPDLSMYQGFIKDISVRTMPYTSTGKGYTKITVTTNNVPAMHGYSKVFLPAPKQAIETQKEFFVEENVNDQYSERTSLREPVQKEFRQEASNVGQKYSYTDEVNEEEKKVLEQESLTEEEVSENEDVSVDVTISSEKESFERMLLILGSFLIIAISVFLYMRAKERLAEIAGENIQIDVSDDKVVKKKDSKTKKIKDTIKKLDSAYAKTAVYQNIKKIETSEPIVNEKLNVVDLDELFKEKANISNKQTEEEENLALEEFLSGFSFDETLVPVMENSAGYDVEFYDELMAKEDVEFSNDDIECIKKLLNAEIVGSTLQNLDRYLISNPIKTPESRQKILEDIVSTYAISQKIIFTQNDIDALQKLISVELDSDFVTDLRTNPKRVEKMRKEIEGFNSELKKPSDIKTLYVSELLPDLSEEVRKQAGKKIQSEAKAETIYFSEGYEVSTLKVDLPDISKEINNESAYISKPSASYDIVDNSYEVQTFTVDSDLPDLQDALEHPEKYEVVEEEVIVDENKLIKNISKVQFKPFFEGQDFEVLNEFEDMPSVDDVQKEMSQFGNIEVIEEAQIEPEKANEYDDFESLYNNEYVDLDNPEKSTFKEQEIIKEQQNLQMINHQDLPVKKKERTSISEDLLNKIALRREERKQKNSSNVDVVKNENKQIKKEESKESEIKCVFAGESYKVLSSVEMIPNVGCYLAKNGNGYKVLGYVGDKICALKQYDELKSEKIQARKNEDLADGASRYIVRIGMIKFIVNVKSDSIDYVMDL